MVLARRVSGSLICAYLTGCGQNLPPLLLSKLKRWVKTKMAKMQIHISRHWDFSINFILSASSGRKCRHGALWKKSVAGVSRTVRKSFKKSDNGKGSYVLISMYFWAEIVEQEFIPRMEKEYRYKQTELLFTPMDHLFKAPPQAKYRAFWQRIF